MRRRGHSRPCLPMGLVLCVMGGVALCAEQPPWSTDTPAGLRLQETVAVINAGDPDAIRSHVLETFTPKSLEFFGADDLVSRFYGLSEMYGGLDFHHVRSSSPDKEVAVFSCRGVGAAYVLGLTVEHEAPHRARGLTILPLPSVEEREGSPRFTDQEMVDLLAGALDGFATRGVFSGVVLVARNDTILLHRAYGPADREAGVAATVHTRFNLASIGKMFTAVAIAQLDEEGLLSYQDPIGTYLGNDWIPPEVGRQVRIEHLLSHTSGIGGEDVNIAYVEEAVARGFTRVEDYKSMTVGTQLRFEPGTRFEYSNLGYHLLGAIIERVAGQSYADRIASQVFARAGMADAALCGADIPPATKAIGYEKIRAGDAVVYRDNRGRIPACATPAGLSYGTASDLLQFAKALRHDTLVTAQTREMLFDPQARLNSPRYGYGFEAREFEGRRTVGHGGGYAGINNLFAIGQDDAYTVIILSNLDILTGTVCHDLGLIIGQMLGGK